MTPAELATIFDEAAELCYLIGAIAALENENVEFPHAKRLLNFRLGQLVKVAGEQIVKPEPTDSPQTIATTIRNLEEIAERKRGRPKGAKNKAPRADKGVSRNVKKRQETSKPVALPNEAEIRAQARCINPTTGQGCGKLLSECVCGQDIQLPAKVGDAGPQT